MGTSPRIGHREMALELQLHEDQIEDLRSICRIEVTCLQGVVDRLNALDRPPLQPAGLLDEVQKSLEDRGSAEALLRQVLSFSGLVRRSGFDLDEAIAGLRSAIKRESSAASGELDRWSQVESSFKALVSSRPVRLVTNAISLSYDYANLYRRGRILTDIRPLFSEDAKSIQGAVVSFTLRLRYESQRNTHELSIAMDEIDIRELAEGCERALMKAQTALELMVRHANVPTIISGGDSTDGIDRDS